MTDVNTNVENSDEEVDDFNAEEEYKELPLVPDGTYYGAITQASFKGAMLSITVTLNDENEGVCSDGETLIEGNAIQYKVWLPKPGDENAMTASGRQTKRQWKINNLKKAADALKLALYSPAQIREAIEDGLMIGHEVMATVGNKEFNGDVSNEITKAVARPE